MKIKVELTRDEIKNHGFNRAMHLKWQLEDMIDYLISIDGSAKELLDEIQKNKK